MFNTSLDSRVSDHPICREVSHIHVLSVWLSSRQHVLGHTCFLPFLLSFHDEEKRRLCVAHQRMRAEEGCGGRRIRGSNTEVSCLLTLCRCRHAFQRHERRGREWKLEGEEEEEEESLFKADAVKERADDYRLREGGRGVEGGRVRESWRKETQWASWNDTVTVFKKCTAFNHIFSTPINLPSVCVCVCVCVIVCVYFSTTFQLAPLLRRTASLRERVRINEISAPLLSTTSLFCTVVPNSP